MFLQEFAYTLQPTEPEITKNNTQSRYATKSIVNLTSNIAIEKSSVKFIDINPPELVSLSISPLSVDVTSEDKIVNVDVSFRDETGIAIHHSFWLRGHGLYINDQGMEEWVYDPNTELWSTTLTFVIDTNKPSGVWEFSVGGAFRDSLGNATPSGYYSVSKLKELGFNPLITVINIDSDAQFDSKITPIFDYQNITTTQTTDFQLTIESSTEYELSINTNEHTNLIGMKFLDAVSLANYCSILSTKINCTFSANPSVDYITVRVTSSSFNSHEFGLNAFLTPKGASLESDWSSNSFNFSALDYDNDGYPNGTDSDDDNDGLEDSVDAFSFNAAASVDTDLDGQPDSFHESCDESCVASSGLTLDLDDDNDGYSDIDELASETDPLLASSLPADNDGDFISDFTDSDDDNDGVEDSVDAFAFNAAASVDTDLDGQPDSFHENCDESCVASSGLTLDLDDDNDGIFDLDDSSPLDYKVGDNEPAIFAKLEDVTFEATSVETYIQLETPIVTDNNLNPAIVTSSTSLPATLGTHEVLWTATDFVGNKSTAVQLIHIVDTTPPGFDEVATKTIDARGFTTDITNDIQEVAYDMVDGSISATIIGDTLYRSGKHIVTVQAEDKSGNSANKDIVLHINPIVSIKQSVKAEIGTLYRVPIYLSGEAAIYPVTVEYQISGDSIDTMTDEIVINEGNEGFIDVNIPENAVMGDVLNIALVSASNAVLRENSTSNLTLFDINFAPTISVAFEQNNQTVSVVTIDSGIAKIIVNISDLNLSDTHSVRWDVGNNTLLEDLNIDDSPMTFEFDASALDGGSYDLSVSVSEDNTIEKNTVSTNISLVVENTLQTLSHLVDTDNDGISDADEGYADSDQDGISDYLDADSDTSRLPINEYTNPMETLAELKLSLGDVVLSANGTLSANASLDIDDITNVSVNNGNDVDNSIDVQFEALSPILNFKLTGLEVTGDVVPVVIPLSEDSSIPEGAVYRKYTVTLGWFDFVVDSDNKISSAHKNKDGICPAPNSSEYEVGLNAGDNCIQLSIKDGGPNDADGKANGIVIDPGVLALERPNTAPVIDLVDYLEVNERSEVTLDASQTSDAENNELIYQWSQLSGTTVNLIEASSEKLVFTSPSVITDELLTFELTVSDGVNEVTEIIEVQVKQINIKPTVTIETTSTSVDEGLDVTLVAKGVDGDNDPLSYQWVQVSGPAVTLNTDTSSSLTFTAPAITSDEILEFMITVNDGFESDSDNILLTINNLPDPVSPKLEPKEDKSGGSMGWIILFIVSGLLSKRLTQRAA